MKRYGLLFFFLLISYFSNAQYLYLFRDTTTNKVGFRDSETDKIIIPAKYSECLNFSEGFIPLKLGNYWGVVDTNGKEIIPFKYFKIKEIKHGLMSASLGDKKVGVIDIFGRTIVPFDHAWCVVVTNNVIQVGKNKLMGAYNRGPGYQDYDVETKTTTLSQLVIPIIYKEMGNAFDKIGNNPSKKIDGLFIVENNEKKYGLIDENGMIIEPCTMDSFPRFKDGKAAVWEGGKLKYYRNTKGEIILN